ncbi:MAG: hypothetical protein KJO16_01925 [Muriicola sp.]|nr:hypothetical protein [Muriicola sp.]MBT8283109.1 hypothetical protein [Muriicola sp.]NNK09764.1 hypothetical protein [Flavobacteriaceae bacterium]
MKVDLIERAEKFEEMKMSHMSTSDRVVASREAKDLILSINKIYKKTKESELMEIMKKITVKKKRIEQRLKGRPLV